MEDLSKAKIYCMRDVYGNFSLLNTMTKEEWPIDVGAMHMLAKQIDDWLNETQALVIAEASE